MVWKSYSEKNAFNFYKIARCFRFYSKIIKNSQGVGYLQGSKKFQNCESEKNRIYIRHISSILLRNEKKRKKNILEFIKKINVLRDLNKM